MNGNEILDQLNDVEVVIKLRVVVKKDEIVKWFGDPGEYKEGETDLNETVENIADDVRYGISTSYGKITDINIVNSG